MKALPLSYPDNSEDVVRLDREAPALRIRLMAALKIFELGSLSSGHAAELAGISRVEFLEVCGRYRVSVFNYSDDETESELRADFVALERHASTR